jgi:hypothetical protein
MSEEVLGIFPCIIRKQSSSLYVTTERLIFHVEGGGAGDAYVIRMSDIVGFVMNKPRPELSRNEQKTLIKVQYRESSQPEVVDRVIDFTGDDRFTNVVSCESLFRQHAGDKADQRRIILKREAERQISARVKFLQSNPHVRELFEYLTSSEGGGLTTEEFWEQYSSELIDIGTETEGEAIGIPVPLRRSQTATDITSNIADTSRRTEPIVSPEKAEEIFAQFPKAKSLFEQLVPHSISEQNFWKRFFQSQFFHLSQGQVVSSGRNDTVFDTLTLGEESEGRAGIRPGEIAVDPEIDLSMDWFLVDSSIHTFHENGKDATSVLDRSTEKAAVPHATLIRRFNVFSAKDYAKEAPGSKDLVDAMKRRGEFVEHATDDDPFKRDLNDNQYFPENQRVAVTKSQLDKLRRMRRKLKVGSRTAAMSDYAPLEMSIGMPGVANATIEMTTDVAQPEESAGGPVSNKRVRKLMAAPESSQLDEYVERVSEVVKFLFAAKPRESPERRQKLVDASARIRAEIQNSFLPKSKLANEWMGTLGMINAMITNAEVINSSINTIQM